MTRRIAPSRGRVRALTLVELLLALSVTALAGMATASMLSMVGTVAQADREGRSTLLRAHAAQTRLRAYFEPSLCLLQNDTTRSALAVWLSDPRGPETVNLTELRVLWFDSVARTVVVERVEFPAGWPQVTKDSADVPLLKSSDFVSVMLAQRALGRTVRQTLVERAWSLSWAFDTAAGQPTTPAKRVRATIQLGVDAANARTLLFTFGLAGQRAPVL